MWVKVTAGIWLAGAVWGAEIECPKTVEVRQVALATPQGWTASVSAATPRLASVQFFDGKPEEEAQLAPDRFDTRGRTFNRSYWEFTGGTQIWMTCTYTGTSVVLSRELSSVKQCTVLYRRGVTVDGLPQIANIYCR